MLDGILKSIKSSVLSVLPIVIIVAFLDCILHFSAETLIAFYISALLLSVGISLFTFGADVSMMDVGNDLGRNLVKSKKLVFICIVVFFVGIAVTVAEPDLYVFAFQQNSVPSMALIITTAVGVGLFLLIAALRTLYNFNTSNLFIIFYTVVLFLIFLVPQDYVASAFDAGGVTTGAISVPFIIALGLGLSANRTDNESKNNSFGMIGLCSIGPIIAMLVLGVFCHTSGEYIPAEIVSNGLFQDLVANFISSFRNTCISLIPIIIVFTLQQLLSINKNFVEIRRNILGLFMTLLGLTLFLTGVQTGFLNLGYTIGSKLIITNHKILFIIMGMLIGYFSVYAEPAVRVLTLQIEKATEGSISKNIVLLCLSVGTAIAVGISFIRAIVGIPIVYFIVPGYLLTVLLTFVTPKLFVSIAFDAGGTVIGPLSSSFILPIAIGACLASGGNVLTDAFGLISLVAVIPLIIIQLFGIIYESKKKYSYVQLNIEEKIIEYNWEG